MKEGSAMLWKPDVCIYHGGCDDGFGAAYAVWKRWGDDVEYVEGRYGAAPPDAPFAAAWFKRGDGKFQCSLRSDDSRLDVSDIAKSYGGGGHRNAAGFEVPSERALRHPTQSG